MKEMAQSSELVDSPARRREAVIILKIFAMYRRYLYLSIPTVSYGTVCSGGLTDGHKARWRALLCAFKIPLQVPYVTNFIV